MLLKRNENWSDDSTAVYELDNLRWISIILNDDGSIKGLDMFDLRKESYGLIGAYSCKCKMFPSSITVHYDELLSTKLLELLSDAFEVVYEA